MKAIFLLCVVALLSSCTADWHLRKAISKDPTILLQGRVIEYHTDTILVAIPEVQVDTVHRWSVDTVTSYVDKVRIRTKVDTVDRYVYVDVLCPADTVYIEHTTERTVIQPRVQRRSLDSDWRILLVILGIVIFAYVIRDK
jgi:hypothetical protein